MKPPPFEYQVPRTLDEALDLLARHGPEAKILAGGQSLIPSMNFRMLQPAILIDVNRLPDLGGIRLADHGGLSIGALTRQAMVERDALVGQHAPLLSEVVPHIAHPQIRNRGTIGGSLAHADPASELPVYAIAREVRLRLISTRGERWLAAQDFFQGMFMTALEPDELLVEIEIPALRANSGWSFQEVARRRGDYAMMGVAACLELSEDGTCKDVKLVYLNAGDGPVRARQAEQLLAGATPDPDLFALAASEAAEEEIDPFGNVHATVEFQRHLARVLTIRVLAAAYARARNGRDA
jgi:CO/xanthine dehydrogenase FAD-binding subunit